MIKAKAIKKDSLNFNQKNYFFNIRNVLLASFD